MISAMGPYHPRLLFNMALVQLTRRHSASGHVVSKVSTCLYVSWTVLPAHGQVLVPTEGLEPPTY